MPRRHWVQSVAACAAVFAVLLPCPIVNAADDAPVPAHANAPDLGAGYKLARGPYVTREQDLVLHDAAREKDLPIKLRVPQGPAPAAGWPVVVFSHGAGGSRDAFGDLTDHWASHGYAVILPTHEDSIQLRRQQGGQSALPVTASGRAALLKTVDLRRRVGDVRFIADSLGAIERASPLLGENSLSRTRLVMAGHSAGAFTTQLVIGVRARGTRVGASTNLRPEHVGDPRFVAGIIVSGQGTSSAALTDKSWDELSVPIFVIAGSLDESPAQMGRETPATRRHPFEFSRGVAQGGPPAYLLYLDGATHSSYAGKATARFLNEAPTTDVRLIQDAVASGTLAFLDAYALGDAGANDYLAGDALTGVIPGKVEFKRK